MGEWVSVDEKWKFNNDLKDSITDFNSKFENKNIEIKNQEKQE